jgi:hypothetical protein
MAKLFATVEGALTHITRQIPDSKPTELIIKHTPDRCLIHEIVMLDFSKDKQEMLAYYKTTDTGRFIVVEFNLKEGVRIRSIENSSDLIVPTDDTIWVSRSK